MQMTLKPKHLIAANENEPLAFTFQEIRILILSFLNGLAIGFAATYLVIWR